MKLSIKLSILAIVPAILFLSLLFYNLNSKLVDVVKQNAVNQQLKESDRLNEQVDFILNEIKNIISVIAVSDDVEINNKDMIKSKFLKYFKSLPQLYELKYISLNGLEILGISKDNIFQESTDQFYFNENIFQTPLIEDRFFMSDFYFSKITDELMVNISKKIIDMNTGEVLGVVIAKVTLNNFQNMITNKLLDNDGIVVLNNNTNNFIYKSSSSKAIDDKYFIDNKTNKIFYTNVNSTKYLISHNNYNHLDLNMSFFTLQKEKKLFSFINNIIMENIAILFIVILLTSLFIVLVIKQKLKPLQNLIKKIKNDVKEIDSRHKDITIRDDEIDELAIYFNLFDTTIRKERKKLKEFNAQLEDRIKQEVEKNREKDTLLFEQSKMVFIGEMLTNIAHQWRQPLSVISTVASGITIKQDYGKFDEKELRSDMENIIQSTEYLSSTIDNFSKFFENDEQKTNFNILKILKNINSLQYKDLYNHGIDVIDEFENISDVQIVGYENELKQVILNILKNAKDQLNKQKIDKPKLIFIKVLKTDSEIQIIITDNAGGIEQNIISKVFEPYFTTKHQSQGTGLGLYMSQEIIIKHFDGHIVVKNSEFEYENTTYKGAQFTISLPF